MGIAGRIRGTFGALSNADGCAAGFRGFVGRLLGNNGGCFRGSTTTYRLADVGTDSESLVAEVKPLMAPEGKQKG